jgi:hypothetical protein
MNKQTHSISIVGRPVAVADASYRGTVLPRQLPPVMDISTKDTATDWD